MTPEVVWFKRDLRTADHAPLVAAAKRGPVICLFIYEPQMLSAADFSRRHLLFVNDSLRDLDASLHALGSRLLIRTGDALDVVRTLHQETGFARIRMHQETTNGIAYERDRRLLAWAASEGVECVEYRQQGVVRRLQNRDGWAKQWQVFVTSPLVPVPRRLVDGAPQLVSEKVQEPSAFGLQDDGLVWRQEGGEREGVDVLRDFLKSRSREYLQGLSSPATAWDACSRLSPYLAYGNLSIRSVYQRTKARRLDLQRSRGASNDWVKALAAFEERLAWHCHFIQKLEDEPRIEFENMNRGFDGLREQHFDAAYFEAWKAGRTGYPMVDACMRALTATGWINFRMRAMLVSFASHHLWLHWREPALHLARLFVDYEPGIHYSQIQMQSGTTGISALRIYSPIKQALDQDPDGQFIRQWVPELAGVPKQHVAEPHRMSRDAQAAAGCLIGRDYPAPIVEHTAAYRAAKQRMHDARKAARVSGESERVFRRHGSRRRSRAHQNQL